MKTRMAIAALGAAISLNTQTFANLWTFSGNYVSGAQASMLQASDGNFYGTTQGNSNTVGTVFRITPAGTLTTLFTFSQAAVEGASPLALTAASDGNFYGMTSTAGPNSGGTIFKITPGGTLTTIYSFTPQQTGSGLSGMLVQGADGNFYGTSASGGANNSGWFFKLTPAGGLTPLYNFGPLASDAGPPGFVLRGIDGNFYGTTNPGDLTSGTVYKITPGGALTVL